MSLLFRLMQTLGGGGGNILLSDAFVFDFTGGFAAARYQLNSTGDIIHTTRTLGPTIAGAWASPKSLAPGSYECRADLISGAVTWGTTGSWLALTSNRVWEVISIGAGFREATLQISIRLGGTVLTTATVILQTEAY